MSYSGGEKKQTKVARRTPALSAIWAGHDEDTHGEDGAHVKLLILHLLLRQLQGKQKHPWCVAVLLSKQSQRGLGLFDASVYSCVASEMIGGVRNLIWLKLFRAVGSVQQTLKAANHKDLHTCTFSFSWQDLSPILCVKWQRQPFFPMLVSSIVFVFCFFFFF